jgi:hypothetical protein
MLKDLFHSTNVIHRMKILNSKHKDTTGWTEMKQKIILTLFAGKHEQQFSFSIFFSPKINIKSCPQPWSLERINRQQ